MAFDSRSALRQRHVAAVDAAGEQRQTLVRRRRTDHRRRGEGPEVCRRQQLLADAGPAVGGVGGVARHRAVVVDEADESRVLHPGLFGGHRRPQDPLGKRYPGREFDGVGALRDRPDLGDGLRAHDRGCSGGSPGSASCSSRSARVNRSPSALEDEIRCLAVILEAGQLGAEDRGVEKSRLGVTDRGERGRGSSTGRPVASTTPVRNPMEERCPSPIPRTLSTNRRLPAPCPPGRDARRCSGCTARRLRWRTRW